MPDKIKDKINVGITIPTWQVLTFVVSLAVTGSWYGSSVVAKLETLIEIVRETKMTQSAQQTQINQISDRQIGALSAISNHSESIRDLNGRVSTIERGRGK